MLEHSYILEVYSWTEQIIGLTCNDDKNVKEIFCIVWYIYTQNKALGQSFISHIKKWANNVQLSKDVKASVFTLGDIDDIIFSQFQDQINFVTAMAFGEAKFDILYDTLISQWMSYKFTKNKLVWEWHVTVEDLFK